MRISAIILSASLSLFVASQLTAQQRDDSSENDAGDNVAAIQDNAAVDRDREKPKDRDKRSAKRSDRKPGIDPIAIFQRLDRDNDGVLTPEETPARMHQRLKQLDADGNGTISKQEFSAAINKRMGSNRTRPDKPNIDQNKTNSDGNNKMGRQQSEAGLAKMLSRLDLDGDGKLSIEEAPERMKDKFARIDTNGDNFVEKQELAKAIERMKSGTEKGRYGTDPEKSKGQQPKRPPGRSAGGK